MGRVIDVEMNLGQGTFESFLSYHSALAPSAR